jgi:hypothetical protein
MLKSLRAERPASWRGLATAMAWSWHMASTPASPQGYVLVLFLFAAKVPIFLSFL